MKKERDVVFLGRSKSRFEFSDSLVTKFVASRDEAEFMQQYPDVFVSILDIQNDHFDMPRLESPKIPEELETALFYGLSSLKTLWKNESNTSLLPQWRDALHTHLTEYRSAYKLDIDPNLISFLVMSVPEPKRNAVIHGDPTLANILWDRPHLRWRWIDPLHRYYIPGDPAVDVGKMIQSCLGYELVLLGRMPEFNFNMIERISHESGIEMRYALRWALIHVIRLLPYQRPADRNIFEGILKDDRLRDLYL